MSSIPEKKLITLKSSDGCELTTEFAVVQLSEIIKQMVELDDGLANTVIPLPNVEGAVLKKVIEYCNKHVEAANNTNMSADELRNWDMEFVNPLGKDELFPLANAAHYLSINGLLDLTCDAVANMIKGKTPEQLRETFGIVNDFTPEEEQEIRRENQWAFDEDVVSD